MENINLTRTDLETLFELVAGRIHDKELSADEQIKSDSKWIWLTEMSLKQLCQLQSKLFDQWQKVRAEEIK